MKRISSVFLCISAIFGLTTVNPGAKAQDGNYAELAARIVKTSANVKPGDVVVVAAGKHNIAFAEALAIEAKKQGGLVTIFMDSDALERATFKDVPDQYLAQEPTYFVDWIKHTNVFILLPGVEDPKATFADIPPERFAKASKAGQVITDTLNSSGVRVVSVGYPTQSDAAVNQLDLGTYQKVFWEAVDADYTAISAEGEKLQQMLKAAKRVHVTSRSGTDFAFSVGDRPIFLDDGTMTEEKAKSQNFLTRAVSLPGGDIFLAPIESSVNGRVVVPRDQCNFEAMKNERFDIKNGQLENYKADTGAECYAKLVASWEGDKEVFASFQIGLNPRASVIENPGDYRPGYAAGLVTIGIGDNRLLGGKNKVPGGTGYLFPIVDATVEIDGKTVVKDGKLTL